MNFKSLLVILIICSITALSGTQVHADPADEFKRETDYLIKKLNYLGSTNLNDDSTLQFNLKLEDAKASLDYKAIVDTCLEYSLDTKSVLLSLNFSW